jgi:hypothetical protein
LNSRQPFRFLSCSRFWFCSCSCGCFSWRPGSRRGGAPADGLRWCPPLGAMGYARSAAWSCARGEPARLARGSFARGFREHRTEHRRPLRSDARSGALVGRGAQGGADRCAQNTKEKTERSDHHIFWRCDDGRSPEECRCARCCRVGRALDVTVLSAAGVREVARRVRLISEKSAGPSVAKG